MKILCVIDHFGSGGAQRQMVNLACGLKERGHNVEMFIYYPKYCFFREIIEDANIPIHEAESSKGVSLKVLLALVSVLKIGKFEAVISFLDTPNTYCELAKILFPRLKLIVSERGASEADKYKDAVYLKRLFHALSTFVVVNSYHHAKRLRDYFWLKRKVHVVWNGYSVERFSHNTNEKVKHDCFVVIARQSREKNCINLILALDLFYKKHGFTPRLHWIGRRKVDPLNEEYYKQITVLMDHLSHVKACWSWLGELPNAATIISSYRALILPSFHEGLPNAICESFIAGRPVLASNVCDNPLLVEDGVRGYLFDPHEPESITTAIETAFFLPNEDWQKQCNNAREFAEDSLQLRTMVSTYENLLNLS